MLQGTYVDDFDERGKNCIHLQIFGHNFALIVSKYRLEYELVSGQFS